MRLLQIALIAFGLSTLSNVNAAIIDTSTFTVSASGSLNSIAGSGSVTEPFLLPENSVFEYFTVELSSFDINPESVGLPQSLSLTLWNSDLSIGSGLYWNLNTGIYIGKEFTVSSSENSGVYEMMLGYIPDSGATTPAHIRTGMAWGFGGISANATAEFTVTAHGSITTVPIPPAVWLFGSGLIGLIGLAKRKAS